MSKTTTKICKYCKTEIPYGAKVCSQCGKKQGGIVKWVILVILAFVVVAAIAGGGKGKESTNTAADASVVENGAKDSNGKKEETVAYTAYEVSELMDDLNGNALKAADKYKGQNVELTGKLNVIDSSGKYISIVPTNSDYAIIGVQCNIKTAEQKTAIMNMSIGDTVVVKGKIKDVGEVLGYTLDITELVQ